MGEVMTNINLIKSKFLILVVWAFFSVADLSGQIPDLPTQPYDYVDYAITHLPTHYQDGDAAAANNTPVDNPITNDGATLGRVLFYDKRLSIAENISCASCHTQETGFGDVRRLSVGHNGAFTDRHSMGLSNAVFYSSGRFRWDEQAETLEDQVLIPISAPNEMALPLPFLRARLSDSPVYNELFTKAFGDATVTDDRIAKALAQFVRSMVSYNSKYDEAIQIVDNEGLPDFAATFNESELLGRELFERTDFSVNCHVCHGTVAQIGNEPRNIGLELIDDDIGAGSGRFKVPSLRNIEVRGRFMHDGRFNSLDEVVEFYNTGVQDNPNLDPFLRVDGQPEGEVIRLELTDSEKQGLVDFMKTLTDHRLLNDPKFSDPFEEPEIIVGDVNGDGVVTALDISPFVDTLVNGPYSFAADPDLDGKINLLDVDRFIDLLLGN